MYRFRHLRLGVARFVSFALPFILVATVALSAALLPRPEPALAAIAVQSVELVSVADNGTQSNNYGNHCSISAADGRYVAFDSLASNLVAGDGNGTMDVFVRDRQTGETTMVSLNSDSVQGDEGSYQPSISSGGRYVAFHSASSNLADDDGDGTYDDDTNGLWDVFVRDLQTGETTRESLNSDNVENPYNGSWGASVSASGRYVAFTSGSSSLVPGDTNYSDDIFVRDRQTYTTTRVSVASDNTQANGESKWPSISANGRYVGFVSYADNLLGTGNDTSDDWDIFLHDLQTHTTTRVSVAYNGDEADGQSTWFSISSDGRYVAFASWATNLVLGDTNGNGDVFVRDRQLSTTTRVSVTSDNAEVSGNCVAPSISASGRYVAFQSVSDDLVASDNNSCEDMFIHDRQTGETARISVSAGGDEGNDESMAPTTPPGGQCISADGQYVAFRSRATNLVAGGTTGWQFFVVQLTIESLADISVDTTSYDFGAVAIGGSSDHTFTVSNIGTDNLTIGQVAGTNPLAAPFTVVTENCSLQTIPPGGYGIVTVRFSPTVIGSFSDSFDIPSNDPDTPSLIVTLTGATPMADISVSPTSYDFGAKAIGSVSNQTFTVSNNGTDNLTIGNVAVADPLAAPFSTVTDGCSGQTILPGESRTLTIRFSPTAKSSFSDSFNVPSNDPDTPTVTVSLTGAVPNAAPTAPVVDVTPNNPTTTAGLVCSIITPSTDADSDNVTYTYQWYKGGVLQGALTTNTVAAASTAKGEVWKCVVTATDGTASVSAEDQVTILNTAPTAPVATVTPESPDGTVDLVCTITTQSTDADGDTITHSYQWYKDGVLQSALTTNTVAAANTAEGQVWRCVVTPSDGAASGTSVEDQVTVAASGNGEPADEEPAGGFPWWAIIVTVIGLLLLIFFFIFFWRRRKKKEEQSAARGTPAP